MKTLIISTAVIGVLSFSPTVSEAGECDAIYSLQGLDPARVKQRRRPELEVASELRRAVRNGCSEEVLALAREPERYERINALTLNDTQRIVLESGLIAALEQVEGNGPVELLKKTIGDAKKPLMTRRRAAVALGRPGQFETLAALASDASLSLEIRSGALLGMGHSEDLRAVLFLRNTALRESSEAQRLGAITALGSLAIAAARGEPELRRASVDTLVELLFAPSLEELSRATMENIVAAGDARAIKTIRAKNAQRSTPINVESALRRLERRSR